MMSSAYQMSSRPSPEALRKDPENQLFHAFTMSRLSAEEIRDSVLAVSGNLNRKAMYGPSIYPLIPPEVLQGQSQPGKGWGKSSPEERARRSIYIHIKRSLQLPILESFDVADLDSSCPVRFSTTQPTQALGMLNGEFLNTQAGIFAEFLKQQAGDDVHAQVELALKRTLQRAPNEAEIRRGIDLIGKMRTEHGLAATDALRQYCLIALNLTEFLFLE
jgi:hypothetical protein